ncbi:MAG: hypothetical protein ACRDA4_09590 [Filifactoraceae bacterium]
MDNNKILSFDELKKKKEKLEKDFFEGNVDKKHVNSLLGQLSDAEREQIKSLMDSFGFGMDDNMKSQIEKILNAKSIDDLIENASSDFFDPGMLGKISEEAKKANEKYKLEYKYYRNFSQWLTIYKPYTLDKFMLIENINTIAKEVNIVLSPSLSKNEIIDKIKNKLNKYLENHLLKFDEDRMTLLGSIISNRGILYLSEPLTDFQERQVDSLSKLGLVFRINESSKKALIIPQEIYDALIEVDFRKFMSTQKVNSIICNTICGLANLYGVIPTKDGKELIWNIVNDINFFDTQESFEKYFNDIVSEYFSTSIISHGYYTNAAINENYIFHPMVGFIEEFYRSQSTSKHKYKEFSYDKLVKEGRNNYYENSIQMNTIWEILNENKSEDEVSIKSLVYTFSKMEFEPQLIIALLETMFEIPIGSKYELLMDSLRSISKRTVKWVLKGYYLGEDTGEGYTIKSENYDPSKIINLDFHKN